MFTTIVIVLLLGWCIFLTVGISKLTQRIEILHKETNNRISVTDQQTHLRINEEINLEEKIANKEIFEKIDIDLPATLREDYLKLLNDIPVPKVRKEKIFEAIRNIIANAQG